MKTIPAIGLCLLFCQPLLAQQRPAQSHFFEGFSAAAGIASNKSTSSTAGSTDIKGSSSVGMARLTYSFASASAAKVSVSMSADLKNSTIDNGVSMNRKTPTELSIEPGVLLTPVTLAYVKVGAYSATYTTPFGSQSVSGNSAGLGLKTYLTENFFIQGEITQRKATGNATLGWDKFKQSSSSLVLGFNF